MNKNTSCHGMLNLTLIYRKCEHLRITSLTTFNFSKNFRLLKAGCPFALNYVHNDVQINNFLKICLH